MHLPALIPVDVMPVPPLTAGDALLALTRDLADLEVRLHAHLTRLAWGLAAVPLQRYAFHPVYVAEDPERNALQGITWRRDDGVAYA